MTQVYSYLDDNKTLTISIKGSFDFSLIYKFRSLYETVTPPPKKVVIDLSNTDSLDSTALGLLLMLQRHMGGVVENILIKDPSDDIIRLLKVSKIDHLFTFDA